MLLFVNHVRTTLESSLSCINLKPIFHAIVRPYRTTASSAILFVASPK